MTPNISTYIGYKPVQYYKEDNLLFKQQDISLNATDFVQVKREWWYI